MIFILDDTLMENKDCLNELAKFLLLACEKEQKVKCSANMFDFLETRVLKVDFIGKQDINLFLAMNLCGTLVLLIRPHLPL